MVVDLMGSTDLMAGMTTIPAGESVTVGLTTVSCPEDGDDCMLTVTQDSVTGIQSATSLGGMIAVAVAGAPMPGSTPTAIELPAGNTVHDQLVEGGPTTLTIAAGNSQDYGGVRFSCPEGGPACVVEFVDDIASASASSPVGSGVASPGAIPNPAFGGGDEIGYLSNESLLMALRHDGTNLVANRGLDPSGDSYSDFTATALTGMVGGINGFAFAGVGPRASQTANLYSTVDAGMQRPFFVVYGSNVSPSTDDAFWTKVMLGTPLMAIHRQAPGAYSGGGNVTYGGTTGTLSCLAAVCEIDPVGRLSGTGAWRFTPTDTALTTMTTVADADYITFGWWQNSPTGLLRENRALWAGSDPFESANVAGLTGTATYTGGAVGHYEERKEEANRINRGTFTGAATLTASFSENRISGSVTGIMDSAAANGGTANLPAGTRVVLRNASLSGNTFSGAVRIDTTADQMTTTGSWNGQFFGNGISARTHPSAVAGEFTALTGSRTVQADEMADMTPATAYINLNGSFGAPRD